MQTSPKNPFKLKFISKLKQFTEILNRENGEKRHLKDIHKLFSSHEGVECWTSRDVQSNKIPEDSTKIIILTAASGAIRNVNDEICSDEYNFELRTIVSVSEFEGWLLGRDNKFWNGTVLGRHNNCLNVCSQKRSEAYLYSQ